MSFTHIFFDLDGTLTDSAPGIIRSVQYALESFHIHKETAELLYFIGPPLKDSFASFFDNDPELTLAAVAKYREYYSVTGIFENSLYAGIADLLTELCRAGHTLCVATSKPEPFALRVLEHFTIREAFAVIAGAELQGSRNSKTDVLRHACRMAGVDPSQGGCCMVGDRKYDILGAHAVGMPALGVLYGYGGRAELEDAGANYLCATVHELRKMLLA